MSNINNIIQQKDEEIANLLSENRILTLELNQCKSDKEFVFNLYEQLQKDKPDVTQAVSFVLNREKEQNEDKDRKVLEMLDAKDAVIRELENEVRLLKSGISSGNRLLSSGFEDQIENASYRSPLAKESYVTGSTYSVKDADQSSNIRQMTNLKRKLEEANCELAKFNKHNQDMTAHLKILKNDLMAEAERADQMQSERNALRKENERLREEIETVQSFHEQLEEELRQKQAQVEDIRRRLEEISSECDRKTDKIRQLEENSYEQERCSRDSEERNLKVVNELKRANEAVRRDSLRVKEECGIKERAIGELQCECERLETQASEQRRRHESELGTFQQQLRDTEQRHRRECAERDKRHQRCVSELEEEQRDRLACHQQDAAKELASCEEAHSRRTDELEERLKGEHQRCVEQINERHKRQLCEKDDHLRECLQQQCDKFERKLAAQEKDFAQRLSCAEEEQRRKQQCATKEADRRVCQKQEELERKLAEHRDECKRRLEQQHDQHCQAARELKECHSEKLQACERRHQNQVKCLKEKAECQVEELKKKLKCQEKHFQCAFQKQEDRFSSLKHEIEKKLIQTDCHGGSESKKLKKTFKNFSDKLSPGCGNLSSSFDTCTDTSFGETPHSSTDVIRCSTPLSSPCRSGRKKKKPSACGTKRSASAKPCRPTQSSPMCRIYYGPPQSPNKELVAARKRVNSLKTKVDCLNILLQLKKDELESVQCAHDRRLRRLQHLQADFKEVIKCHSEMDQQQSACGKRSSNRFLNEKSPESNCCKRSSPTTSNEGDYNQLAVLKRDNKLLEQEKVALEDDIDRLQCQHVQDRATIQELAMGMKAAAGKKSAKKTRRRSASAVRLGGKPSGAAASGIGWTPAPSCGYLQQKQNRLAMSSHRMKGKMRSLQHKLELARKDEAIAVNERRQLSKELDNLRQDVKTLRDDVVEAKGAEMAAREECAEAREEMERCRDGCRDAEKEVRELRKDAEALRDENNAQRYENTHLRSDVAQLRSEIHDLKDEISKLHEERLKVLPQPDAAVTSPSRKPHRRFHSAPRRALVRPSAGVVSRHKRSKSARKYQKFLNKSVMRMKELFGEENFNSDQQYDSQLTESSASASTHHHHHHHQHHQLTATDVSSLGQAIITSARRKKEQVDESFMDENDDSEYIDEEEFTEDSTTPVLSKPSKSSSKKTVRISGVAEPANAAGIGGGCRPSNAGMMGAMLRQKLAALQKQYANVRSAKNALQDKLNKERKRGEELTREAESCRNKLKNCKQNVSRLSRELESARKGRDELIEKHEEELASSKSREQQQRYTDLDYKHVDAKLKAAIHENMRLVSEVQRLKDELEKLSSQAALDRDKITRLERDVTMKRQLIDDLRVKNKTRNEQCQSEIEKSKAERERYELLEGEVRQHKCNVDSLRRQVQALHREKKKDQRSLAQQKRQIEQHEESMAQLKKSEQRAVDEASKMEREARYQMSELASRGEQAIDQLNSQLHRSELRCREHRALVAAMAGKLSEKSCQLREQLCDKEVQKLKREMKEHSMKQAAAAGEKNLRSKKISSHAERIACQILDMSSSDFHQLMAPVTRDASGVGIDDGTREKLERRIEERLRAKVDAQHADGEWRDKVERMCSSEQSPPFAKMLCGELWQKIDDCLKLHQEKLDLACQ